MGCCTSRSTRKGFEPRRTKLGACASTSETARTTGMPFGITRAVSTRGISLDSPRSCQVAWIDPEGAVAGGGEPERRSEHAGEMRLVGESRLARHVDQGTRRVDQVARQGETPHEEIAMWARAEHRPELTRELVARQPRDRLELRRVHGARALRVEELSRALDRRDVDAPYRGRSRAASLRAQQRVGQVDDDAVCRERVKPPAEGVLDRPSRSRITRNPLHPERQRAWAAAKRSQGVGEASGLDVDDAVSEALAGAGPAVVGLVGIEHDDLAARADP